MWQPDAPEGDGSSGGPGQERREGETPPHDSASEEAQARGFTGSGGAPDNRVAANDDASAQGPQPEDARPPEGGPDSIRPLPRDATRAPRRPAPRRERLFEPDGRHLAKGAASISLLFALLLERTQAKAWSEARQRAHARALLELAPDHYFTDEELAVLEAFLQ